jgi:ankyrin repeat protein
VVDGNEAWVDELPPLVRAAYRGDDRTVERLLHSGVNPNQADESGWTALHAAATTNHLHAVQQLLRAGATVDARTEDSFTPVLNAAQAGPDVIAALLDAGADAAVQHPRYGWRPLDRFAEHSNVEAIRLLLKTGVEVNARGIDGSTALMSAAEAGSLECVALLLHAGADPTLSSEGDTAGSLAGHQGHHAVAALLALREQRKGAAGQG